MSITVNAQQINSDSLWNIWEDENFDDSTRFRALGKLAFYSLFSDPDTGYYYAQIQLDQAIIKKDVYFQADAINTQGAFYYFKGKYDIAIQHFDRSLQLYKSIDDFENVGNILNNISGVYVNLNAFDDALKYLHEGLDFFKDSGYDIGLAMSYSNLGTVYVYKSEEIDSSATRDMYLDSAFYFLNKGLNKSEEIGYLQSKGNALSNLGVVHFYWNNFDSAKFYLNESLFLKRANGNLEGVSEDLVYLSQISRKEKKLQQSFDYALEALQIGEQLGISSTVKNASLSLYKNYKLRNDFRMALSMLEKYLKAKDEIESEDNQKEVLRQQYKYEYEKKAVSDSVAFAKEKEITAVQLEKQDAEIQARKNQQYGLYGGLLLVALFAGFIYNRFKVTRKQKAIIEEAHGQLEEKNEEILDSISYAKRIQTAILPPDKLVKEYLKNSFILYKPKDIVAGDFYWMERQDGKVLFAAADCTGHGVPGAMVSVICNNGLNRSTREFGLSDPGEILSKTRDLVIAEFEKSEEEVKDGMDIALCALEGNKLRYAGAHNPLWIIRNGISQVEEIKADKQPIGKYANPKPFTTHEIELNPGDTFYIFSDGFADQFGGEKGKKFKSANFKKLLLSIQHESIDHQKARIEQAFGSWKGQLEQLDDVCVIGVRV